MGSQIRILESADYDRFRLHNFNRDATKLKRLVLSMKKYGWIAAYPMHVTREHDPYYRIKAGHHRFLAAKELKIPCKFVLCDDAASIHELEAATNPWSMQDYLTSHIRSGKKDYLVLKEYHDRTGISLSQCISILVGESASLWNKNEDFKAGNFIVGDSTKRAGIVADLIRYCTDIGIKEARISNFVGAVSLLADLDEFNPEVFKHKARVWKSLFQKQPTLAGYIQMIEAIYNRQNQNKTPFSFLIETKAKQRQVRPRKNGRWNGS